MITSLQHSPCKAAQEFLARLSQFKITKN